MNRKMIVLFFVICFLVFSFNVGAVFNLFLKNYDYELTDSSKVLFLFDGADIRFNGWKKDFVRITPNEFTKKNVKIIAGANKFVFDGEDYLGQYPDERKAGFIIHIPENILLNVQADNLRVYGALLANVRCNNLLVREASIAADIELLANKTTIRDVSIADGCRIETGNLLMRDSRFKDAEIVINGDYNVKDYECQLKAVKGNEVDLTFKNCNHSFMEVKNNTSMNKLIINSDNKNGLLVVQRDCEVSILENNTLLPIKEVSY